MVTDEIVASVEDALKLLDRGPDGFVPKEDPVTKTENPPPKPVEPTNEVKPEEPKKGQ